MGAPTTTDHLFDLSPDALRCPHATYARLREEAPVAWSDRLGCFIVSRYEDVSSVLKDTAVFSNTLANGPGSATPLARRVMEDPNESDELRQMAARRTAIAETPVLLFTDGPLHTRQRKLVNRAFTPRRVAVMEEPIRQIANDLVDEFAPAGEVELSSRFAVLLPMYVIADALGVSREDSAKFKEWSDAFVMSNGNPNMTRDDIAYMLREINGFYDYFTDQIRQREESPSDDLLTDIINARIDGTEPLKTTEMLGMLSQFLVAGNETTAKLIASAMLRLVTDPDLMAEVRSSPDLIPGLVEETLRLDAPAAGMFRLAMEDTEVGGVEIPKGSSLFLPYLSANSDERQFPDPDRVDLRRSFTRPHLAFGQGDHFCLGASLARAEGRVGIDVLLRRLDDIELQVPPEQLAYVPSVSFRGVMQLPLRFRPA